MSLTSLPTSCASIEEVGQGAVPHSKCGLVLLHGVGRENHARIEYYISFALSLTSMSSTERRSAR